MRPLTWIAAAFCFATLPALATTQPSRTPANTVQQDAAAMCRSACLGTAAGAPGGLTAQAAQICAIRCGAGQAYLSQQSLRGSAEASGRGRVAAPIAVSTGMSPMGRGHGAIYGGRTPSAAFGLVVGANDRLSAHRLAEGQCSQRGGGCRPLVEFTASCGAVAQAVQRSQWALMITADPNTFVVTSISGGSGPSLAAAEADAIAECRSKDRGAICRVVASACRGNG